MHQVRAQSALLRAHFVFGDDKSDDRDADNQE